MSFCAKTSPLWSRRGQQSAFVRERVKSIPVVFAFSQPYKTVRLDSPSRSFDPRMCQKSRDLPPARAPSQAQDSAQRWCGLAVRRCPRPSRLRDPARRRQQSVNTAAAIAVRALLIFIRTSVLCSLVRSQYRLRNPAVNSHHPDRLCECLRFAASRGPILRAPSRRSGVRMRDSPRTVPSSRSARRSACSCPAF
jgi:hypothetical protein